MCEKTSGLNESASTNLLKLEEVPRKFLLSYYSLSKGTIYQYQYCLVRFSNARRDLRGHSHTKLVGSEKYSIDKFPTSIKHIVANSGFPEVSRIVEQYADYQNNIRPINETTKRILIMFGNST